MAKRSEAERASLAERDRTILRGAKAGDPAARDKALEIIRADIGKIAKKWARWLLRAGLWQDVCQQVRELFLTRLAKGEHLPEDKPLYYLAGDLLRQVAKPRQTEVKWAKLAFSLDARPVETKERSKADVEIIESTYSTHGYAGPHRLAAAREMAQWFVWADEALSDEDRELISAVVAVDAGEFESLGEALGTADGTARMRKRRLHEKLARLAISEGNLEMARRLAGKRYADAVELLCVAEPGADHRIEELSLLRAGELETAKKIELESHVKGCTGCRRALRTLDAVDEAERAFLVLPPDLIASEVNWPPEGRSRIAKAAGAAVVAIAALLWWLWPAKAPAPTPPPPPKPAPPADARPVPARRSDDLAAPTPTPTRTRKEDAGAK
ncbi:MAG: hypothetical protein ACYDCL_11920 [Myxococcales bacterium]